MDHRVLTLGEILKFFKRRKLTLPDNCPPDIIRQLYDYFHVNGRLRERRVKAYRECSSTHLNRRVRIKTGLYANETGQIRWLKPEPQVGDSVKAIRPTTGGTLHQRGNQTGWIDVAWINNPKEGFRFSVLLDSRKPVTLAGMQLELLPRPPAQPDSKTKSPTKKA